MTHVAPELKEGIYRIFPVSPPAKRLEQRHKPFDLVVVVEYRIDRDQGLGSVFGAGGFRVWCLYELDLQGVRVRRS